MSKNNNIKKSDKTFIRKEKARIRSQFLDVKKQEELINNLYKKFLNKPETTGAAPDKKEEKKVEVKPVTAKVSGSPKKVKKITSKK